MLLDHWSPSKVSVHHRPLHKVRDNPPTSLSGVQVVDVSAASLLMVIGDMYCNTVVCKSFSEVK